MPTSVAAVPDETYRPGKCSRCAYDITGMTPGARCPECGTPVPVEAGR